MPQRHDVPSLKLLAIRVISWPDGVHRQIDEGFPNDVSRTREINVVSVLRRRGTAALNVRPRHRSRRQEVIGGSGYNLVEQIVNTWIRLSTFYATRLDEIQQMRYFCAIGKDNIETLDFLFEGMKMRDGTDFWDIAGILPMSLSPIEIDPFTWQSITRLLITTGTMQHIKYLYMKLEASGRLATDESLFRFSKTMAGFESLVKLVVHGDANDAMLEAIGRHCNFLEFLDVRDTNVTEKGVLKLLFKNTDFVKRLKNSNTEYQFPEGALNPLTSRLKYLDISTVPYKGILMERNRAVLFACEYLVQTPRRFFFYPGGTTRMFCTMDNQLKDFRNKVIASIRTSLVDIFLQLTRSLWPCLTQGFTHVESRADGNGDEVSFNFYNIDYIVVHMKLQNLVIVDVVVHSASTCDFIPLEILSACVPTLCHLKASVRGTVDAPSSLPKLRTITSPIMHSKSTIISIFQNCNSLEYLEVRELFHGLNTLTDDDISQIVSQGNLNLEVVRILFENSITFAGLRSLFLDCRNLKLVGDLKYWATPLPSIVKLKLNMNFHNFDVAFEYEGIVYGTRKPCKEM